MFLFLLGTHQKLGYMVTLCLTLPEQLDCFPKQLYCFKYSAAVYEEFHFSYMLVIICYLF